MPLWTAGRSGLSPASLRLPSAHWALERRQCAASAGRRATGLRWPSPLLFPLTHPPRGPEDWALLLSADDWTMRGRLQPLSADCLPGGSGRVAPRSRLDSWTMRAASSPSACSPPRGSGREGITLPSGAPSLCGLSPAPRHSCPDAACLPPPRPFAQRARGKGKGAPLMRSALAVPAVWPNQTGSIVMSGSSSWCCMMTWTILSGDSSASSVSSSLMKPRVSMSM